MGTGQSIQQTEIVSYSDPNTPDISPRSVTEDQSFISSKQEISALSSSQSQELFDIVDVDDSVGSLNDDGSGSSSELEKYNIEINHPELSIINSLSQLPSLVDHSIKRSQIEQVLALMVESNNGMKFREHKIFRKEFEMCFSAKEFVDWMMNNTIVAAREQAVWIGKELVYFKFVSYVGKGKFEFCDNNDLYYISHVPHEKLPIGEIDALLRLTYFEREEISLLYEKFKSISTLMAIDRHWRPNIGNTILGHLQIKNPEVYLMTTESLLKGLPELQGTELVNCIDIFLNCFWTRHTPQKTITFAEFLVTLSVIARGSQRERSLLITKICSKNDKQRICRNHVIELAETIHRSLTSLKMENSFISGNITEIIDEIFYPVHVNELSRVDKVKNTFMKALDSAEKILHKIPSDDKSTPNIIVEKKRSLSDSSKIRLHSKRILSKNRKSEKILSKSGNRNKIQNSTQILETTLIIENPPENDEIIVAKKNTVKKQLTEKPENNPESNEILENEIQILDVTEKILEIHKEVKPENIQISEKSNPEKIEEILEKEIVQENKEQQTIEINIPNLLNKETESKFELKISEISSENIEIRESISSTSSPRIHITIDINPTKKNRKSRHKSSHRKHVPSPREKVTLNIIPKKSSREVTTESKDDEVTSLKLTEDNTSSENIGTECSQDFIEIPRSGSVTPRNTLQPPDQYSRHSLKKIYHDSSDDEDIVVSLSRPVNYLVQNIFEKRIVKNPIIMDFFGLFTYITEIFVRTIVKYMKNSDSNVQMEGYGLLLDTIIIKIVRFE